MANAIMYGRVRRGRAMPSRRAIRCGMVPSLLFIVESPWQAKHCNASTDLPVRIIWLPESANLHAT